MAHATPSPPGRGGLPPSGPRMALVEGQRIDRSVLLRATEALCRRDRDLAAVVARHGPPPLWARRPGFATLALIILEQQVSLASGRAAYRRLERAAGGVTADRVARVTERELRDAGLTRQKARYCRGLAERICDGSLSLRRVARADDEAARALLCEVVGIGRWTADVYLLFALRRPDLWPPGDLALEVALQRLKGLPAKPRPERALAIAAAWRPWRSVAARLLWHFYLSTRRPEAGS